MFTSNFQKLMPFLSDDLILKNVAGEEIAASKFREQNYDYNYTTSSNNYTDEQGVSDFYNWIVASSNAGDCGFVLFVGSGLTSPTIDDYKLENPLNLEVLSASCTHNGSTTIVTRTFKNNTEEEVTINELGLYVFATNRKSPFVLLARKVLSEPIILNPNETYTFTYNFTIKDFKVTEL